MNPARPAGTSIGLVVLAVGLCSCGWNHVEPPGQKSIWQRLFGMDDDPDTQADPETLELLRSALGSAGQDPSMAGRWIFYCRDEIRWDNRYRIVDSVTNSWMDDSRYLDIEFPTGPKLRLHPTQTRGQPGIAVPLFGDPRDTAFAIADGNVDTAEFNRRKLPCPRPGPTDARGTPLLRP